MREVASSMVIKVQGTAVGIPARNAAVLGNNRVDSNRVNTVWLQEVSRCQGADARLSLGDLARTYSELRSAYREEYVMYNLAAAALAQVLKVTWTLLWAAVVLCFPRSFVVQQHSLWCCVHVT